MDSQESSPTPQFKSISSFAISFLYSPTLTSIHDHMDYLSTEVELKGVCIFPRVGLPAHDGSATVLLALSPNFRPSDLGWENITPLLELSPPGRLCPSKHDRRPYAERRTRGSVTRAPAQEPTGASECVTAQSPSEDAGGVVSRHFDPVRVFCPMAPADPADPAVGDSPGCQIQTQARGGCPQPSLSIRNRRKL